MSIMTRKKSVCLKWTLGFIVVVLCQFVHSRPQELSPAPTYVQTTETTRYRNRNNEHHLALFKQPIVISFVNNSDFNSSNISVKRNNTNLNKNLKTNKEISLFFIDINRNKNISSSVRSRRLITTKIKSNDLRKKLNSFIIRNKNKNVQIANYKNNFKVSEPGYTETITNPQKNKPPIRKIVTKWRDKAKYEDLDFNLETTTSNENNFHSLDIDNPSNVQPIHNDVSTEAAKKVSNYQNLNKLYNKLMNNRYKPRPEYSEETQVYSSNVHIIDRYPFSNAGPTYVFTTPMPTPIITNVGNPQPWHRPSFQNGNRKTTKKPVQTKKPIKNQYDYHNSMIHNSQYPHDNFEVTTSHPSTTYTDRIVIRPEEYSASPDDCPTIFLTLNNTFEGQGKEACPDLNIAVNTNVVNKNVVIESEEDESENLFPDVFDIPTDDSAEAEGTQANDYFESLENEDLEESASVEGDELTNYNAANEEITADSPETGGFGSPSTNLASLQKPSRPVDDDLFTFSGFLDFFRPSLNALSWLVSLSPFNFGLLSFFFSPIAMIFAGAYGVASFFSSLPLAREAPKIIHVLQPQWQWDNNIKSWHLNSFPADRVTHIRIPKSSNKDTNSVKPTWFYKLKEWMKGKIMELREKSEKHPLQHIRSNKRKKRETWTRIGSQKQTENEKKEETISNNTSSRDVKTKGSGIGDSIKMVASQLLENPSNTTVSAPIVADTRIPPKLKNQLAQKHKIKTRNENGNEPMENGHVGVAVPVTMEELETENKISEIPNESSTSNEGISTWILLSNPTSKDNVTFTTEPTKADEENVKKPKPVAAKNKNKRPQVNKASIAKRPFIGSTNKSDLVAGGSAINENVYNKLKDTVLSNVQKNKSTSTHRTTAPTTSTITSTTEPFTTKKEIVTKASSILPVAVTSKPIKKKIKNKHKTSTTTEVTTANESALLPMEPKEQEIELEISTPATTTKKPKRSSNKKKKTKKRKTSKPKPENETTEIKTSNKTKSSKPSKKPSTDVTGVTTQIYNYFSREVMPSVGVGVIGLASLVGLASYFLYPFATPVRRTFEVDKKDDLYKHNAEEYASDGNGQAEEEMLGTVLAGMPAHSKHKLNPYAGQTTHMNRNPYPVKKEQDIRYRHVSTSSYEPNYNVRYPQQKTGIAHGAVYSEPINYNHQVPQQPQYETRHVYTTESKYAYDKGPTSYTPSYPAVEPIYAAPQTGPSGISSYGSDSSNTVVYGVKPSSDSDFKPVYPFEGQYYGEHQTTSNPMTYPPTSMYLGSNNDAEQQENNKYDEGADDVNSSADNKFVVGNVPKELSDSVTPAVVPEHGPRNLSRKKRSPLNRKRSITGSIEEILKIAKENNKDVLLSNEIDEALGVTVKNVPKATTKASNTNDNKTAELKQVIPVYSVTVNTSDEAVTTTSSPVTTKKIAFVESVSTLPINGNKQEETTGIEMSNELELTTKAFRVYEVFSSNSPNGVTEMSNKNEESKGETTKIKNAMTETTTEVKSETSTAIPTTETKKPSSSTLRPRPTAFPDVPEVVTYPPLNQEGSIFTFLKRIIEFKYRLGLSLIQNTSASINRYLRNMESTVQNVAKASKA